MKVEMKEIHEKDNEFTEALAIVAKYVLAQHSDATGNEDPEDVPFAMLLGGFEGMKVCVAVGTHADAIPGLVERAMAVQEAVAVLMGGMEEKFSTKH